MKTLKSHLSIDRLIAPVMLRILLWPALAAFIYYSSWLIFKGNASGCVPLTIGSLCVRI
ncbi:MAG TPA: hypothetical protein VKN36_16705 [Eudoraea sp.]|nr:hypothetical protein [Eudoraea sp.]